MRKGIAWLGGRKLIVTILGVFSLVAQSYFNIEISSDTMQSVKELILVYLGVAGASTIASNLKK